MHRYHGRRPPLADQRVGRAIVVRSGGRAKADAIAVTTDSDSAHILRTLMTYEDAGITDTANESVKVTCTVSPRLSCWMNFCISGDLA